MPRYTLHYEYNKFNGSCTEMSTTTTIWNIVPSIRFPVSTVQRTDCEEKSIFVENGKKSIFDKNGKKYIILLLYMLYIIDIIVISKCFYLH